MICPLGYTKRDCEADFIADYCEIDLIDFINYLEEGGRCRVILIIASPTCTYRCVFCPVGYFRLILYRQIADAAREQEGTLRHRWSSIAGGEEGGAAR